MPLPARLLLAATGALLIVRAAGQSVTDPHITTWLTSKSGQYARIYETSSDKSSGNAVATWPKASLTNGGGGQSTAAYADVQRVAYSANFVYISTTGLASYAMGNWLNPQGGVFMFWPTNRAAIHRIPRTATIPTTKTKANGVGGVWLNGVYLWENGDAQSYSTSSATVSFNGDGIWNRLAGVAEAFNFDPGNGHQPSSGAYHTHINPIALRYQLGDNVTYNASSKTYAESSPTHHSPILGWALDGLPVYGPYGYSTATNSSSGVRRMTTGFQKRDGTNGTTNLASTGRHTLPVWAASVQGKSQTLATTQYGPAVNTTYPLGTFAEDYEYLGDLGKTQGTDFDLNRQNVRFCVTPEYPSGTYAYFVCLDSSGATAFPDVINQEFYGSAAGGQGTVSSITESVTEYVDGGPAAAIAVTATASGNGVALSWNSAEGATYKVESSADNSTFTTLSSAVTSAGLTTTYSAAAVASYFRVTLTAIATYDSGGTFGTAVGKTGTVQFGAVATPPGITTNPASATVSSGASASFTVGASGTAPLTYQWQKNGSAIPGATAATYSIAAAQSTDGGSYTCVVTNSAGAATSSAAILTVNATPTAPSITTQPSGVTVAAGAALNLTVAAGGSTPLTYQWRKNGTAISGATSSTYSVASAQAVDSGSYTVVVTNGLGSATSNAANVVVNSPTTAPSITTQPADSTVAAGGSVTLTVGASGTAPLTYQWQKNGSAIAGASGASFTIASAQSGDAGTYTCVASNAAGSATSRGAVVTVSVPVTAPTITSSPASASVLVGGTATFAATATGTAPLGYQWLKSGTPVAGATNASLTIGPVQATDAGGFTVIVSNAAGSATSGVAALTVTTAAVAPSIAAPPANATANVGGSATFGVVASGTAPLTYQWLKNGGLIVGANAATYQIPVVAVSDAGDFSCTVTNAVGSATSAAATLTVTTNAVAPGISSQPANVSTTAGSTIAFNIGATGTAPLTYQWQKNGGPIAGATSSGLTLSNVQAADVASYRCVVTNTAGSVTSAPASLNLTATAVAPAITTQPASAAVTAGATVSFSVAADGSAPFSYQWLRNGVAIAGATSSTLTLSPVQVADAGMIAAVVTNAGGSATSGSATLSVDPAAVATARIINLAVRARVGGAAPPPTTGFVLSGNGAGKRVILRAVGPTLGAFGVGGVMADPKLELNAGGTVIGSNDDWLAADVTAFADVGAFPLVAGAADAAIVTILAPGAYTTPVAVASGSGGIVLLECYDGAPDDTSVRLVNASALAFVGAGDDVLIPGFVISGEGTVRVLVRAVGPGLAQFGVGGTLADPQITLYKGGSPIAVNDDWGISTNSDEIAGAAVAVGAFALPKNSHDAVLLVSLAAGAYSATVSGVGGTTGTALVEVYVVAP